MRIVITPKAVAPALAAILLTLLTACGTEDAAAPTGDGVAGATPSTSPSTTSSGRSGDEPSPSQAAAEPAPADLAVVVDGAEITPNAQGISVDVGDPLSVSVKADRAGELHVHSKPEQYFPFQPGETSFELTVQTPGSVEVEDDDTGDVVALLEVS